RGGLRVDLRVRAVVGLVRRAVDPALDAVRDRLRRGRALLGGGRGAVALPGRLHLALVRLRLWNRGLLLLVLLALGRGLLAGVESLEDGRGERVDLLAGGGALRLPARPAL